MSALEMALPSLLLMIVPLCLDVPPEAQDVPAQLARAFSVSRARTSAVDAGAELLEKAIALCWGVQRYVHV